MASAQVLTNSAASSRKQDHLKAGKKLLEEFRRKKAAKKTTVADQPANADSVTCATVPQNDGPSPDNLSSNVECSTSQRAAVNDNDLGAHHPNVGVSSEASAYIISTNFPQELSNEPVEKEKNPVSPPYTSFSSSNLPNGYHEQRKNAAGPIERNNSDVNENALQTIVPKAVMDHEMSHTSISYPADDFGAGGRVSSGTFFPFHEPTDEFISSNLPEKSETSALQDLPWTDNKSHLENSPIIGKERYGTTFNEDGALGFAGGMANYGASSNYNSTSSIEPWRSLESSSRNPQLKSVTSPGESFSAPTSNFHVSARLRPSFLDSIGVQRPSPSPHVKLEMAEQAFSFTNSTMQSSPPQQFPKSSSSVHSVELPSSSRHEINNYDMEHKVPTPSSFHPYNSHDVPKQNTEGYHNFAAPGRDEDFAALEQLIEDLTQEKFSLQRALDTSQSLVQSLAADNSALTENFNQQGQIINQLRSDIQKLQEEISAQLLALESAKMEYANAQLECNAADERARLLATEVISLEEKALRLRSNELKLEKKVESLSSEISSYRKKISMFEKERHDFQSTIDALQEERKVLHSKIRSASGTQIVSESAKVSCERKDASTSTDEEIVSISPERHSAPDNALSSTFEMSEDVMPSVSLATSSFHHLDNLAGDIPEDQMRMINNISSLISELSVEREELMRALRIESSNCSKLKDLNKDLTHKLEIQMQRLELLTAQRMASENLLAMPTGTSTETPMYADEGDEVVERVLGWIMKLFPSSGPAKRRTSKLL